MLSDIFKFLLRPFSSDYRLNVVELAEKSNELANTAMDQLTDTREKLFKLQGKIDELEECRRNEKQEKHDCEQKVKELAKRVEELEKSQKG